MCPWQRVIHQGLIKRPSDTLDAIELTHSSLQCVCVWSKKFFITSMLTCNVHMSESKRRIRIKIPVVITVLVMNE